MYTKFKDFRETAEAFILKIEYSNQDVVLLRYKNWIDGVEFSKMVSDFYDGSVTSAYMTEEMFKQYAEERNHPEWLSLIEDADEDAEI